MSLAAFLQMLQTKSVFFSRITKFSDPYEGAMPKTLRTVLDVLGRDHPKIRLADKLEEEAKLFCVSCWHLNDGESAAMWKLYSQDSGIAVQSSVNRLNRGFLGQNYNMASVTYTEFEEAIAIPDISKMIYPVYLKRKSFSHENELRLAIKEPDTTAYPDGKFTPVDLTALIENVYVSPTAPCWLADVVRGEAERFSIPARVVHSGLYSKTLK